jgi:hypothetical protein
MALTLVLVLLAAMVTQELLHSEVIMNRYAIIENGVAVNVVVADAQIAAENGWIACPDAGPGWTYANGVFTAPVVVPPTAPSAPTKEELLAQLQAIQAQIQAL